MRWLPQSLTSNRLAADYGMVGVLLLLCIACTLGTIKKQEPQGTEAARITARQILASTDRHAAVVILAEDAPLVEALHGRLVEAGFTAVQKQTGDPPTLRKELERLVAGEKPIDLIATSRSNRLLIQDVARQSPELSNTAVVFAREYRWPTFLTRSNLLNVANRNVVIGIIAVGMTMVIITGGIDLSVGSLVALSAVLAAWLIERSGATQASAAAMIACSLAAIAASALMGTFSGVMVAIFKIPPFVVTLAMMWVASGLAYIISHGQSIADLPDAFDWLGSDASLPGIPNTLVLMIAIYALGHLIMSRTILGRHVYAIGGNRLAARLSGVRVGRVLLTVYVISGATAGIGGVILASQFVSGTPTYGSMYELHAIAAVVVGGTSLAGGEGKIFGTLIGVFIIAVVQNAMNLLGIEPYPQNVVLGMIVLAVVLLDTLKRHGWRRLFRPE
jgi:ribose transport system permease protein